MSNIQIQIPELGSKYVDDRNRVWGDSYNWAFNRTTLQVTNIAIHHSVTAQTGDWKKEVDVIANIHKNRGWGGVGYHFVVGSDGTVAYVGDVGQGRANVLNKNEKVIGICFVGDFTKVLPTDAQITSGHTLIKFLLGLNMWNIKGWDGVVGHQEMQSTACPGSNWKVGGDSFYERLKNNIPYTSPVDPIPTPTPPVVTPEPPVDLKPVVDKLTKENENLTKENSAFKEKLSKIKGKVLELNQLLN